MSGTLALGDLNRPRMLCLHGGGMNALALRLQGRALFRALQQHFRLVFVNAPFESPPDPSASVLAAYAHLAPFRSWLRWQHDQPDPGPEPICSAILCALANAVEADNATGAHGDCVAVLGFSQGAKIAASLLLDSQLRLAASLPPHRLMAHVRFGVLLAARAPLVCLAPELTDSLALADANEVTTGSFASITGYYLQGTDHVLRVPTVHVHGLQDPGLAQHRQLMQEYCESGTSSLVEWDGDHRVVTKRADVAAVAHQIIALGRLTGAIQ